jgi:pathogenesis-related protein 1
MRWSCLSLLWVVFGLALVGSANRPSAAQNKQLTTFEMSMLAQHNNVRQKNNVPPLAWDDGLAAAAQDWANRIAASGAMPPPHRASGENLFWGTAGQWQPTDVLGVWEAEKANFTAQSCTCAPGKSCVHYTQVVWSTTTRVGCAKARSADGQTDFFVCDYSPEGNTVGQCPFPTSLAPTPAPVARQIASATTPIPAPTPVTRLVTSAATPTPAANPRLGRST